MQSNSAALTTHNQVEIFTDGNTKFSALLSEIHQATDHIHLEYYIYKDDEIGREVITALTERAKAGVSVKLLLDALGASFLPSHFFDGYRAAGGKVAFFFPKTVPFINFRVNYRNHRKIAVIDGKTGFIGGFNIGDDYLGRDPIWGNWRDSALQITGSAALALQIRFFQDWNYAAPQDLIDYEDRYFPEHTVNEEHPIQIVSGGPDTYWNPIKESYLKLISAATESVYIQTPYFIPDESVLDALRIAALSGIDVRIMIPTRPDHPFVYWAGYSYIGQLLDAGVRAYTYDDGFIHAKTIVVDTAAASVGSANWDVRSFRLNFETNAIVYQEEIATRLRDIFIADLHSCSEITPDYYANLPWKLKVKQSVSRLFSPLL